MKEIIVILIVYYLSESGAWDKNKAGPYDIVLERLDRCPGSENDVYHYKYKLKKYNRTCIAVDVDLELTTPFENDMKLTLTIDLFANNGWKENYFQKEFNGLVCDMIKTYTPDMSVKMAEITKTEKCPVPAGNYSTRNFPLAIELKTIPVLFYNKYRTKLVFEKDNKRLLCFFAYAEIVPKRKNKG